MILGERILEVSGKRVPKPNIRGLNINITLDDVVAAGQDLEITYIYTASYAENVGEMKIRGVLIASEDEKLTKEILTSWKSEKRVPDAYAETLLSAINYSGSANGTLIARVIGLTAPLIPPKIQLSKDAGKSPAKK